MPFVQERWREQLRDLAPRDAARVCQSQARCEPDSAASLRLAAPGAARGVLPEERYRRRGVQRAHVRIII